MLDEDKIFKEELLPIPIEENEEEHKKWQKSEYIRFSADGRSNADTQQPLRTEQTNE